MNRAARRAPTTGPDRTRLMSDDGRENGIGAAAAFRRTRSSVLPRGERRTGRRARSRRRAVHLRGGAVLARDKMLRRRPHGPGA